MFIKPKPGVLVRDPVTRQPLPPEGRRVPDGDAYYLRRLRDGDVEITAGTEPAAPGERRSPRQAAR